MSLHWVIETHDEVQSTQDIVMSMAHMEQPEGHVVQAQTQTQGRGRHGRKWESLSGNLFLSILFRPSVQARDVGQLSLITGLSLLEAISSVMGKGNDYELSLKWPNDVLINGEKCAGLLLETELTQSGAVKWVVLGIGVNVAEAPEDLGLALNAFAEKPIAVKVLRDRFLKVMGTHYLHWLQNGFETLRLNWLDRAHAKGRPMHVKIGPQLVNGVFHDIDAHGNLRLKDAEHRLKTVSSGEVYLY